MTWTSEPCEYSEPLVVPVTMKLRGHVEGASVVEAIAEMLGIDPRFVKIKSMEAKKDPLPAPKKKKKKGGGGGAVQASGEGAGFPAQQASAATVVAPKPSGKGGGGGKGGKGGKKGKKGKGRQLDDYDYDVSTG